MCSKKPVYCNDVNIERRIHNVDRIITTGMNATQIAATKKKCRGLKNREQTNEISRTAKQRACL